MFWSRVMCIFSSVWVECHIHEMLPSSAYLRALSGLFVVLFFFVPLRRRSQEQSQLIWGMKDKLKKYCSINDMKELLIANSQDVPAGESNVRAAALYAYSSSLQSFPGFPQRVFLTSPVSVLSF